MKTYNRGFHLFKINIFRGYQAQQKNRKKGKNAQMKDEKKKVLSERRKILNVDHLQGEKLQEKAIALHQW